MDTSTSMTSPHGLPWRERLRDRAVLLGLLLAASTVLGMQASADVAPASDLAGVHAR